MVSNIFYFHPENWGRFPFWLIFLRWVETTNQSKMEVSCDEKIPMGFWLGTLPFASSISTVWSQKKGPWKRGLIVTTSSHVWRSESTRLDRWEVNTTDGKIVSNLVKDLSSDINGKTSECNSWSSTMAWSNRWCWFFQKLHMKVCL